MCSHSASTALKEDDERKTAAVAIHKFNTHLIAFWELSYHAGSHLGYLTTLHPMNRSTSVWMVTSTFSVFALNMKLKLFLGHYRIQLDMASRALNSTLEIIKTAVTNYPHYVEAVDKMEEIENFKADVVGVCRGLLGALRNNVEAFSRNILWRRVFCYRAYYLILLAGKCRKSGTDVSDFDELLDQYSAIVKLMFPNLQEQDFYHRIFYSGMQLTDMFDTFNSSEVSRSRMPVELVKIVRGYCELDPLNPSDEKLIDFNLLQTDK